MSQKRAGKNKVLILLMLAGISAALIRLDSATEGPARQGYESFMSFFSYPQRAVAASWRGVRDFAWGVFARRRLSQSNRELRLRLNMMEQRLAELESYRRENRRLRELLDFRAKADFEEIFRESIGAGVIGRNPVNWYRTVVLDRGAADGVREGMVVIGVGGVAGRVINTGSSASVVMLILDMESKVSAVVERTGEHGIITGRGDGVLIMRYLSDRSEVRAGDAVRTSGLGGIFPKGLSIGAVAGVSEQDYGLTLAAEVSPSVDFSRLENVLILRD